MASPEVERPLASPSSHVSTGAGSGGTKVVTFGRYLDLSVNEGKAASRRHQQQRRSGNSHSSCEEKHANEEKRWCAGGCNHRKGNFSGVPLRKRSYSFSEGHCKTASSLPSNKRWKNSHHSNKDEGSKGSSGGGVGGGGVGNASGGMPPDKANKKNNKFLLGGNIRDPLNLNSLSDERVSRLFNAVTPESSPLPTPKHRKPEYKIEVLIPPNISDPLNLMSGDTEEGEYESQLLSPTFARRMKLGVAGSKDVNPVEMGTAKKVRYRKRTRSTKQYHHSTSVSELTANENAESRTNLESSRATTDIGQPGVSVVADAKDKEKDDNKVGAAGDSKTDTKVEEKLPDIKPPPPPPPIHTWKKLRGAKTTKASIAASSKSSAAAIVSPVILTNPPRFFHHRGFKNRRPSQGGGQSKPQHHKKSVQSGVLQKTQKKCFEYGNYNRYYGYRNAENGTDQRMRYLNPEWFDGKDMLDIGCNVGHLTLAVARAFRPRSVLGVDIDESLIRMAKKNVKRYTSCIMPQQTPSRYGDSQTATPQYGGASSTPSRVAKGDEDELFPMSLPILYGPIDPTNPTLMPASVRGSEHASREAASEATHPSGLGALPFPQNVRFACCNYVMESDDLVDAVQPEYDVILCLSTTKWIHLNFGDDGIKRAFKRMYAQLRPGGRLILEAQGFHSYRKRKNLTPKIKENFKAIQLRPERFRDYLTQEVSFAFGETIGVPQHSSRGFQRPLQVFTKLPPTSSRSASSCQTTPYYCASSSQHNTPYYFPPSPLGMFPPRPGRPCYAPMALTPMYSNQWPESETGYDQPDSTNAGYSPSGSAVNTSSTPGYSPSGGARSVTPSATPTGSGPPSTSNSPFGGHGSP